MTRLGFVALLSLLLTTVAVPASAQIPSEGTIIERVLVRVNGEIFTQSELTQKQLAVLRAEGAGGLSDAALQERLAELTPELLDEAVNELLLVQRGREMGVQFTDEMFQAAVDNIKEDNDLTDAQLTQALQQEGITMAQLRQQFERTYLIQVVQQQEIGPSMTITQAEQRQYYQQYPERFMTIETVTLRQLLIEVPSRPGEPGTLQSPALEAAAQLRIDDLRDEAVAGADFAELVREHSDTPAAARENGGLVGPVNIGDLNQALSQAIQALEPGEVSEPIRTANGYQLLKLEERVEPELQAFELVQPQIEQAIRTERLGPEQDKVLARLRTQAVIEWKDEGFQTMYDQYVAETYDQ